MKFFGFNARVKLLKKLYKSSLEGVYFKKNIYLP